MFEQKAAKVNATLLDFAVFSCYTACEMRDGQVNTLKNRSEKPKYNALQNIGFMIKVAWKHEKQVLVMCILLAVLFVGSQLTELYIAPTIIAAVEQQVSLGTLLATIGGFAALLAVIGGVQSYISANTLYPRVTLRLAIISMINQKSCTTSLVNTYDEIFQKLRGKTDESTGGNNGATEAIWHTLTIVLRNILGIGAYVSILLSVHPVILLVILATSLIGFFVNRYCNSYGYRHREELGGIERKLWYIQGREGDHYAAKDIRIFGLGNWLEELYTDALEAFRAFQFRAQKVYLLSNIAGLLLTFFKNGFAYAFLIMQVVGDGLSASQFLLYFTAVSGASWWIGDLLGNLTVLHTQSLDISTVREFLEYPEPYTFAGGKPIRQTDTPSEIKLENVTFRYPNSDKNVLQNFDLTLHAGEKLAVVGLNGAGKTTLIMLLCGLLDPTEGRVTLDGTDIRELDRAQYYKLFSAVFQRFTVLAASVSQNVAQSNEQVDMERVKACIADAGLTSKIESLPNGYDAMLNREIYEDATELSGGELQRLMLARALYKNAPFIILDEPTAALDPIAESEIYEAYNDMTAGKSAVFISHRLASTRFCDRIILIENGNIAESGTHRELMNKQGRYAELFAVQSKYYGEGSVTV